jgi:anti-sigma-K factor RskA
MAETVDIHALAGAYALDAVDDIERAAFDRHLRSCESCALEVAELRETVAWLSHPVAEPAPPGLRAAVLAEVARTPQERTRRSGSGRVSSSSASVGRWRRWTAAAVAASVVGLGVGAGTWAIMDQRYNAERVANAQFQSVLSAPDAKLVKAQMAGGEVSVVVSPSHNAAVAVLSGLSAPPPDHVYRLWMVGGPDPAPRPIRSLEPGQGDGRQYIDGLNGATTFAVSSELDPDAARPTTPLVGHVDLN